ncbi:MAG TPA: hypothetical protein VGK99_11110 [Acidobacteriota bacterium]|jgi:hypothetical protein
MEGAITALIIYTLTPSKQGWDIHDSVGRCDLPTVRELDRALAILAKFTSGSGQLCKVEVRDEAGLLLQQFYSFSPQNGRCAPCVPEADTVLTWESRVAAELAPAPPNTLRAPLLRSEK